MGGSTEWCLLDELRLIGGLPTPKTVHQYRKGLAHRHIDFWGQVLSYPIRMQLQDALDARLKELTQSEPALP